jgi:hypothetical protein
MLNLDRIKDSLRKAFANLANSFERRLNVISTELANIGGPLEVLDRASPCSSHCQYPFCRISKNTFVRSKGVCPNSQTP